MSKMPAPPLKLLLADLSFLISIANCPALPASMLDNTKHAIFLYYQEVSRSVLCLASSSCRVLNTVSCCHGVKHWPVHFSGAACEGQFLHCENTCKTFNVGTAGDKKESFSLLIFLEAFHRLYCSGN